MIRYWIAFFLLLSGCTSPIARQSESVRQGVYAVTESVQKKRYDLAKKYSEELVRIVPPPKERIDIKAFSIQTGVDKRDYTVLPENADIQNLVVENSEKYLALLEQNKALAVMVGQEVAAFDKYRKKADESLISMGDSLAAEKKKSFFGFILGALPFAGLGGLILICVFFPPLAPVVISWFTSIVSAIGKLILPKT